MTRITIDVQKDKELLIDLLQRMNIKYESVEKEDHDLLNIIDKGGDGKSIQDPVAWQRQVRKDRKFPFQE